MKTRLKFSFLSVMIAAVVSVSACDTGKTTPVVNTAAQNQPNINQSNVSQNMNEPENKATDVRSGIEELEKKINLPVRPAEVKWTEDIFDNSKGNFPGPSDYKITALLKYDEKGAAQLTEKLGNEMMEQSLGNTPLRDWFPEEIKSQAQTKNEKTFLEGAKYSPKAFFRSPYSNGSLVRIAKTNYFVLNLTSF